MKEHIRWNMFSEEGSFGAELEAARMKISASKSKAKVLNSKRVICLLPQVEEFRYRGVLFTSQGKLEHEIDSESV